MGLRSQLAIVSFGGPGLHLMGMSDSVETWLTLITPADRILDVKTRRAVHQGLGVPQGSF